MANITLGSFTPFTSDITPEDKAVFVDAFEKFVGVKYEPIAVATQVVSGTNYAFFCNATPAYPGATPSPAMVSVFRSLEGHANITHIQKAAY